MRFIRVDISTSDVCLRDCVLHNVLKGLLLACCKVIYCSFILLFYLYGCCSLFAVIFKSLSVLVKLTRPLVSYITTKVGKISIWKCYREVKWFFDELFCPTRYSSRPLHQRNRAHRIVVTFFSFFVFSI